jgi:hypothetical protein
VKTHVGSIFGKLGLRDRAATTVSYDHGVVTPGATLKLKSRRLHLRSEFNSGLQADAHRRRGR